MQLHQRLPCKHTCKVCAGAHSQVIKQQKDKEKAARLLLSEIISDDAQQCTDGGGVLRSETNNSAYVGVKKTRCGKYATELKANKRTLNFGTYPTAIAAAEAIQSLHSLTSVEKVKEWEKRNTVAVQKKKSITAWRQKGDLPLLALISAQCPTL